MPLQAGASPDGRERRGGVTRTGQQQRVRGKRVRIISGDHGSTKAREGLGGSVHGVGLAARRSRVVEH